MLFLKTYTSVKIKVVLVSEIFDPITFPRQTYVGISTGVAKHEEQFTQKTCHAYLIRYLRFYF
jgi:hypothetical protein